MTCPDQAPIVDTLEAGSGPLVVLVHSTVSGARQWRALMGELEARYHLIAVNLLGYGRTPAWASRQPQTLDDQAGLIEAALPNEHESISIVGHSYGGASGDWSPAAETFAGNWGGAGTWRH